MSDDNLFRYVLLAAFVLVMPIGIYHRLRAATSERLDRRQEGLFILISIRLLGLVGMTSFVLFMIDPAWMA